MSPDAVDENRVLDLLEHWYDRRAAGDEPTPEDLTDDPAVRAALRDRIAAAKALDPVAAEADTGGGSGTAADDRPPDLPR